MTTNEERREIARKLRELEEDVLSLIDAWDEEGIYTICQDQADYYQIHFALMGCIPSVHTHPCDYAELHERLADLIEPEPERTCKNLSDSGWFTCSECGANVYGAAYGSSYVDGDGKRWYTTANPPQWNYCPNCGAKVIS